MVRQPGVFEGKTGGEMTYAERLRLFFGKIKVDHASGCWNWTGAVRSWSKEPWDGGYAAFWDGERVVRGHVWLWRQYFGELKPGEVLLHACDNRRCVNIFRHIKPGTQAQNVKDMLAKGRATHQRKKATIQREDHHGEGIQGGSADESRQSPDGTVPVGPPGA